jgi:L-lactate dehydrogenase complex protein LldE
MEEQSKRTALFVTCLVDQFFPRVGEATVHLLEQAGCRVEFPREQTCCGQPAFNMGYRDEARELARRFIDIFSPFEAVVSPSGSCTSMVRVYYADLFEGDPVWHDKALDLARRTFELTEYLDQSGFEPRSTFEGKVTYHPSCHLLRELGVDEAPLKLLRQVPGVELVDLPNAEICCGFGGAFSVKMSGLSEAMLEDKIKSVESTSADVLTATDCGCLMQMGGGLTRRGSAVRALHVAEILAGTF